MWKDPFYMDKRAKSLLEIDKICANIKQDHSKCQLEINYLKDINKKLKEERDEIQKAYESEINYNNNKLLASTNQINYRILSLRLSEISDLNENDINEAIACIIRRRHRKDSVGLYNINWENPDMYYYYNFSDEIRMKFEELLEHIQEIENGNINNINNMKYQIIVKDYDNKINELHQRIKEYEERIKDLELKLEEGQIDIKEDNDNELEITIDKVKYDEKYLNNDDVTALMFDLFPYETYSTSV